MLQKNVKEVMDSNGVRILVDLLTLAHLHTSRAMVPLQVDARLQLPVHSHMLLQLPLC